MSHSVGTIEMGLAGAGDPFVLYNLVQDPSGSSYLTNRGTAGNNFDALGDGGDFYNDYTDTPLPPGGAGQIFRNYDDFGSSDLCAPWSVVFAYPPGGYMFIQWLLYGENWDGWLINLEIEAASFGRLLLWNSAFPFNARGGFEVLIFNIPNSADALGLSYNPVSGVASGFIGTNTAPVDLWGACGCEDWFFGGTDCTGQFHGAPEYPAPYAETVVYPFNGGGSVSPSAFGAAAFRGELQRDDMAYWANYDWATHPGFA